MRQENTLRVPPGIPQVILRKLSSGSKGVDTDEGSHSELKLSEGHKSHAFSTREQELHNEEWGH